MDYAAIAAKNGGTVAPPATAGGGGIDYAAIAAKYGGNAAGAKPANTGAPKLTPPAPTTNNPQYSTSTIDQGDANALNGANTVAKFLGVQKAGQGIATAIRVADGSVNQTGDEAAQGLQDTTKLAAQLHQMILDNVPATDPRRIQLVNFLRKSQGQQPVTQADIDPGTQLTTKETLGSFGNFGLDAIGGGELEGAGPVTDAIGKVVAPLSSDGVVGRVGNAAIKAGEFGAAQGVAQGANDNQDAAGIAQDAGKGTILNGILGGGLQGFGELAKYLTSPEVSETLYNRAIGIDKKTAVADRSPSAGMIADRKVGTASGLMTDAQNTIDQTNGQIKNILATDTTQHNTSDLIEQMRSALTKQYGDTLGPEGVQQLMDTLPIAKLKNNETLSTADLNGLRQKIDSDFVGNGKWLSVNQDPVKISSYKTAANVLRQTVQGQDARLPALYDTLSNSITARNSLGKELAKPHALTHMLEILSGLGAGGAALLHGDPAAIATGLGTAGLFHAANSTLGQTATAVGLNEANKQLENPGLISKLGATIGRIVGRRGVAKVADKP